MLGFRRNELEEIPSIEVQEQMILENEEMSEEEKKKALNKLKWKKLTSFFKNGGKVY